MAKTNRKFNQKKKNLKTERQNPKQIQKTNDQKDKGQTGKIYLQLVLQRDNLPNT